MSKQQLGTNTFTTAKWIVSPTASDGTHTTIAGALAAASSGDTIFIRPGTYTENPTLVAGVNLAAFQCDYLGHVIINGTCTLTTAGAVVITGIQLKTNSAALLAVTGSAASVVTLQNCYLNCVNNTGITFSSSSGSSGITLNNCSGDVATTGITLFSHSSAGLLIFNYCIFTNTGSSTTASTVSAGTMTTFSSSFNTLITTSGTGALSSQSTTFGNAVNGISVTLGGTGSNGSNYDNYSSGSASCVSVGTGATANITNAVIASSNTNSIAGAGTVSYGDLIFTGSSKTIGTTTQTNYNTSTFTPVVNFGGATTGITYTTQTGKYRRNGDTVFFQIAIQLSSKGSATGVATITGLPFTSSSVPSVYDFIGDVVTITSPALTTYFFFDLSSGASTLSIYAAAAQAGGATQLADTNFANGTILRVQGTYFI
jgi:hypothetical protein